jgi:hypothetical protein
MKKKRKQNMKMNNKAKKELPFNVQTNMKKSIDPNTK